MVRRHLFNFVPMIMDFLYWDQRFKIVKIVKKLIKNMSGQKNKKKHLKLVTYAIYCYVIVPLSIYLFKYIIV